MKDPYKRFSGWYDTIFEPLNSGLRAIGMKMFPPQTGMKVLDIGCGTGAHLNLYQKAGCEVYGIDTSPSMFEQAKQKLGEEAYLHFGDASKMPYDDNLFDLITTSTVLHEMPPEVRSNVLDEAKRVLKEDGHILLIDFHIGPFKPLKGWFYKSIITIAEISAGREHFKNYRQFMRTGGLATLIEKHGLSVAKEKILSGGNMVIYLLRYSERNPKAGRKEP
jgi:ubiquinone/menaquinone biosynthesis C-methylase UbiE